MAVFRPYTAADYAPVWALWTQINRDLAPEHLKDRFERYIETALRAELDALEEAFDPKTRNRFWVVDAPPIVGAFGIQARSAETCELRRMYLSKAFRGGGLASRMLAFAEAQARDLGFRTMVLSTAQFQRAAIRLYEKNGYVLNSREVAETMSVATIGGGVERLHFSKQL